MGTGNALNRSPGAQLLGCGVSLRLIYAEGFRSHKISSRCVGTRTASHAHMAELAASALPFQSIVVAKSMEDIGVLPDVRERLLAKISGKSWEVSAREDFA